MSDVFNRGTDTNPVHTGLYVVDRGDKLGTPFRWFDAESKTWGRCEYTLEDAMNQYLKQPKPSSSTFILTGADGANA